MDKGTQRNLHTMHGYCTIWITSNVTRHKGCIRVRKMAMCHASQGPHSARFSVTNSKRCQIRRKMAENWIFSPIYQFYLISCLFLVVPWLEYSSKLYFNSNIIRILYECHCHWPRIRSFGKVQICPVSQAIRSDSNGTVYMISAGLLVCQDETKNQEKA